MVWSAASAAEVNLGFCHAEAPLSYKNGPGVGANDSSWVGDLEVDTGCKLERAAGLDWV